MDVLDYKILQQLQNSADLPLSELAKRVGVSKTACWNRIRRLEEEGIIKGRHTILDRDKLGLPIIVFLSITVGRHSPQWVERFTAIIQDFDEITEVHRLTGEGADYQLKMICQTIHDYDLLQQKLISQIDFTSMSSRVSLQELKQSYHLPLHLKPSVEKA